MCCVMFAQNMAFTLGFIYWFDHAANRANINKWKPKHIQNGVTFILRRSCLFHFTCYIQIEMRFLNSGNIESNTWRDIIVKANKEKIKNWRTNNRKFPIFSSAKSLQMKFYVLQFTVASLWRAERGHKIYTYMYIKIQFCFRLTWLFLYIFFGLQLTTETKKSTVSMFT